MSIADRKTAVDEAPPMVTPASKDRIFRSTDAGQEGLRLYEHTGPRGLPAPGFWPPAGKYNIAMVDLHTKPLRDYLPGHWLELIKLTSIADAIGSIQHPDGSALSETLTDELLNQSADILHNVASALEDKAQPTAELLKLRAKELVSRQYGTAAAQQAETNHDDLMVLCGPLTSWRSKSRQLLHSAAVALEDKKHTQKLADLDHTLPRLLKFFEQSTGIDNLNLVPLPGFTILDMAVCGGEANKYPKHFSYFLPEDEGVKRAPIKKTAVFQNIYLKRFQAVSLPLLALYSGTIDQDTQTKLNDPMWLLTWFKGHDIGHSVRTDTTDFKAVKKFGFDASVTLQEATADVLGFIALFGPWNLNNPPDQYAAGVTVLAELLRYLRRGANYFPDSAAAFLELSFLTQNGFLSIDPDRKAINWEPIKLFEGMCRLAELLIKALLVPDLDLIQQILDKHSHWSNKAFGAGVTELLRPAARMPHDVGYNLVVD